MNVQVHAGLLPQFFSVMASNVRSRTATISVIAVTSDASAEGCDCGCCCEECCDCGCGCGC